MFSNSFNSLHSTALYKNAVSVVAVVVPREGSYIMICRWLMSIPTFASLPSRQSERRRARRKVNVIARVSILRLAAEKMYEVDTIQSAAIRTAIVNATTTTPRN